MSRTSAGEASTGTDSTGTDSTVSAEAVSAEAVGTEPVDANETGTDHAGVEPTDTDEAEQSATDQEQSAGDQEQPVADEEQAAADREKAARKAAKRYRRRGRIAVGSALALVLLIAGGIFGFGYWATHNKPAYQVPQHVAKQRDGIIAGGSGKVRVDVYVDYQCPGCKAFSDTVGSTLDQLVASNAITLVYHPLALLDGTSPTQYSMRAAASAACASNMGSFLPYSNMLFANQPKSAAGLSDDQLVLLGGRTGMINPAFAQCVRAGTYDKWVAKENAMAAKKGVTTAPTVLVDGRTIAPAGTAPTQAELQAAIG